MIFGARAECAFHWRASLSHAVHQGLRLGLRTHILTVSTFVARWSPGSGFAVLIYCLLRL